MTAKPTDRGPGAFSLLPQLCSLIRLRLECEYGSKLGPATGLPVCSLNYSCRSRGLLDVLAEEAGQLNMCMPTQ